MFTSMMRKRMFAGQSCYINASMFSITTYGKTQFVKIIFTRMLLENRIYYLMNDYTNLHQIMQ